MKIGIISYFFYPAITPRAFRAFELVKELEKQSHDVVVFIPDIDYDYQADSNLKNVTIKEIPPGFYLNKKNRNVVSSKNSDSKVDFSIQNNNKISKRIKTKLINWFYPGAFSFEFGFTCGIALRQEKETFDILISIGLPICSHLAVFIGTIFNKKLCNVALADYGDPYSFNRFINPPFFHKWFEKLILSRIDIIMVPTINAIGSYTYFKDEKFIKVIPQGINFMNIRLSEVSKQDSIIKFVFAGNFYSGIRDPKELFDFLVEYENPFKFILYTDKMNDDNMNLIKPYLIALGNKIEINNLLPRIQCIYEMSKADFLINIYNTSSEQTPSKLIDYYLTRRPIFSYTPGAFDKSIFNLFLQKNYTFDISNTIPIEDFKIETVVKNIFNIVEEFQKGN